MVCCSSGSSCKYVKYAGMVHLFAVVLVHHVSLIWTPEYAWANADRQVWCSHHVLLKWVTKWATLPMNSHSSVIIIQQQWYNDELCQWIVIHPWFPSKEAKEHVSSNSFPARSHFLPVTLEDSTDIGPIYQDTHLQELHKKSLLRIQTWYSDPVILWPWKIQLIIGPIYIGIHSSKNCIRTPWSCNALCHGSPRTLWSYSATATLLFYISL